VPHHGGLLLELADDVDRVVGNLRQRLGRTVAAAQVGGTYCPEIFHTATGDM
jgi:hypothetical protein